jgi:hypothetical protein
MTRAKEIDPKIKLQIEAQVKALATLEMERDTRSKATNFQERYFLWKPLDDRCKLLKNELLQLGKALGVTKEQIDATIQEEKAITTKP